MKTKKFNWKSYWSPTPKLFRKIGDSILASLTIVSASAIIADDKKIAIIALIAGVLAKFMSNFFTDDEQQSQ